MAAPAWRVALWQGADGFDGPQTAPAPDGTALFQADDPAVFIGFADMFGDGLQNLVRVSSGAVWIWPNLGYGRFGARRMMLNAPLFSRDLTAERTEEHTSELQSLMRISYAVFCLHIKNKIHI